MVFKFLLGELLGIFGIIFFAFNYELIDKGLKGLLKSWCGC